MTSLGQMSGYESSSRTRANSKIRQYGIVANWARVSNPPDCADPGLRPDRRRDQVAKRPNTSRTDARASVGGRHLLHGFFGRLQPRSPALPAAASSHLENRPLSNPLWTQPLETEDLSRKTGTLTLAQRVLVLREKTLNRQQGPNGVWRGHLPSGTSVRDDARYPLPP